MCHFSSNRVKWWGGCERNLVDSLLVAQSCNTWLLLEVEVAKSNMAKESVLVILTVAAPFSGI